MKDPSPETLKMRLYKALFKRREKIYYKGYEINVLIMF